MANRGPLLIWGAGGHAAVAAEVAQAAGYTLAGIFADAPPTRPWPDGLYLGAYDPAFHQDVPLLLAIGDNKARTSAEKQVRHRFVPALVHPSAIISPGAVLGEGTIVFHGAIIQVGAIVGSHCIINTGASIDHDCRIGDFTHIGPQVALCGNVGVGEGALLGVGARVIPGKHIGDWAIVGAGGVVVHDVPDRITVVGVPAR